MIYASLWPGAAETPHANGSADMGLDQDVPGHGVLCAPCYNVVTLTDQYDQCMADSMTTYSIREAKAHLSEILRDLDHGEEVIITRRGRPCGRLTVVDTSSDDKPSLATLRGALSELPDAEYQDFQDIKGIWETRTELPEGMTGRVDG